MKKSVLTILCVFYTLILFSQNQNKSGIVNYNVTIKLDIKLDGELAQFAHMIPKENKSKTILTFNEKASVYEQNNNAKDEENLENSNTGMNVRIYSSSNADEKTYTDFNTNKILKQQEFLSRQFIIESNIENSGWKITGNQKNILGYTCTEAVKVKDTIVSKVWFVPSIPVSAGPEKLSGQLPGLILEASLKNGKVSIVASQVEFKPITDNQIVKPKGGKSVTQAEYDAIVAEKTKDMKKSGNGKAVIYHYRN